MINRNSPEYEKETVILAQIDLTTGSIPKTLLRFAFPMICGNLLQQLYNVADTLIVGRFLGSDALGAVGSSYTLMTFLTSILLGLCMGSGALFSVCWGQRDLARLRRQTHAAFVLIAVCTVVLNAAAFLLLDAMKTLLSVPAEVWPLMRSYLFVIFFGIGGTFLYNYYASLLRAVGNSLVPLLFLAASAVLNIALDLVFVLVCRWGVEGAAAATVLAQWLSGIGTAVYTLVRCPELRARREERRITGSMLRELLSAFTRPGKFGGSFENRLRIVTEIIAGIEKSYGVRIRIMSPDDGKRYDINYLRSNSLEEVVDIVEFMTGTHCEVIRNE